MSTTSLSLKAANGKYVEAGPQRLNLFANATNPTDAVVQITLEALPNGQCAINQQGLYWSAQPDGTLQANRASVGLWETFKKVKGQRTGSVAFQSVYLNAFITAPLDGSALTCQAPAVNDWESFDLPPGAVVVLDPLSITGLTFGNGWQFRGATDFGLAYRILKGDDVDEVIAQRVETGAGVGRILCMATNLFPFDPDAFSDSDWQAMVAYINGKGYRGSFIALADCSGYAPVPLKPLSWQQQHAARIASFVGPLNLFELANQYNDRYQAVDPSQFPKPAGCLSSRGDGDAGVYCYLPPWDWSGYTIDRNAKWLRNLSKTALDLIGGFDGYAGVNQPFVHTEPQKFNVGGDLTSPIDAFTAGVEMAVWRPYGFAGGAFHCPSGLQSQLWTDAELACAQPFFHGMDQGAA